ncbi:MAG: hypothetical protein AAGF75_06510 [Cyanobacteria bacterium P01_H01_bin.130]
MQFPFLRSLSYPLSCPLSESAPSDTDTASDSSTAAANTPDFPQQLTDNPLYTLAGNLIRHPLSIGLVSLPVLIGLAGGRQAANGLNELGTWSEEVFRGDRLPLLPLSGDRETP